MKPGKSFGTTASRERQETVRDWVDVIAKSVLAAVGVFLTYLAYDYNQKSTVVTLLSQREAAESKLRSDMMDKLIGPFVGGTEQGKTLEPERARVLLELLALNFHPDLELKPLFLQVDKRCCEEDRDALESVARRVVDRQIVMLDAAGGAPDADAERDRGLLSKWFPKSDGSARAKFVVLRFQQAPLEKPLDPMLILREFDDNTEMSKGSPAGDDKKKGFNTGSNPALFSNGNAGQSVCSVSPDEKVALRISVTKYDSDRRTAKVQWRTHTSPGSKVCEQPSEVGWKEAKEVTLTHFDFPLTDNAQVDSHRRFALNLYEDRYPDRERPILDIKLVWFPRDYITERERPMNYFQVRQTLGIE